MPPARLAAAAVTLLLFGGAAPAAEATFTDIRVVGTELRVSSDREPFAGAWTFRINTFGNIVVSGGAKPYALGPGCQFVGNQDAECFNVDRVRAELGNFKDEVDGVGLPYPMVVFSNGGNDHVITGNAVDRIGGGEGNDYINGGPGNDDLIGQEGDDTFDQGAADDGDDGLSGSEGRDVVLYSGRTAPLQVTGDAVANDGEAGEFDNVFNSTEDVVGGSGNDVLVGSASANVLTGGPGNDELVGEGGDDRFPQGAAADGSDSISGRGGVDTVDYADRLAKVTVSIDAVANDGATGELDNVYTSTENVRGGHAGDVLSGSAGPNRLEGGDGNDTFPQGSAPNGADQILGLAGTDLVDYSLRTGAVRAALDASTTSGAPGEGDQLYGSVESANGGQGQNTLIGNASANRLVGGPLSDFIEPLGGIDRALGGGGADELRMQDSAADAETDCGADTDIAYVDAGDPVTPGTCETTSTGPPPGGGVS
ncbi:MAG TPA: calcium-binding protein [Solirubrobacteraceae bacterium]|jgi:Ca2+-binding RTX toxin-like protein